MSAENPRILVTDDEKSIRNALRDILEHEDYRVIEAECGSAAVELIESGEEIDLMLLDIKMKDMNGLEVLDKINGKDAHLPVIMISAHANVEVAVEATKKGAVDFIEKPPDLNRLFLSIKNALNSYRLTKENTGLRSKLPKLAPIIGKSKAIEQIKETIAQVAPTNSTVLITGENGTGKELVARWIHEKSERKLESFVDVNCAAIPPDLLESELFGHEEGAFTGAIQQRIGKFERADKVTMFLDEIGDMSLNAQAKILRVLQEKTITRVGDTENINVNPRLISATNKNLEQEMQDGNFREDLFHRINVIPIHIPPLRKRKKDIPLLAQNYLQQLGSSNISFSKVKFSKGALKALKKREWSGNIRELQNAVERLAILVSGDEIKKSDVQNLSLANIEKKSNLEPLIGGSEDFKKFKEKSERLFLLQKLKENDWNVSQTADSINIQRSHMYTKMKKYNIER